jgi:hypothetical protein
MAKTHAAERKLALGAVDPSSALWKPGLNPLVRKYPARCPPEGRKASRTGARPLEPRRTRALPGRGIRIQKENTP